MTVEELEQAVGRPGGEELPAPHPGQGCRVVAGDRLTGEHLHPVVEDDHVVIGRHDLVDADELTDGHFEPRLLAHLPGDRLDEVLAPLHTTAGKGPPAYPRRPTATHHQQSTVVVLCQRTDGQLWSLADPPAFPSTTGTSLERRPTARSDDRAE